jgi:hypothetical protein
LNAAFGRATGDMAARALDAIAADLASAKSAAKDPS